MQEVGLNARGLQPSTSTDSSSLAQIVVPTIEMLATQIKESDPDEQAMSLSQMALLLVDWTDPSKMV
jgi:hypothetical protein